MLVTFLSLSLSIFLSICLSIFFICVTVSIPVHNSSPRHDSVHTILALHVLDIRKPMQGAGTVLCYKYEDLELELSCGC